VGYYHVGLVDIVTVPPTALGEDVRATLADELNLTPSSIKLVPGGWPTQKEAPGKELALLVPVQDQLQDLPGVDAVQLPVEFLLPDKYMARIRYQYKDLVAALNEPWLQNDATRQMLIASILTTWQRPRTVMRANRSSTLLVTRSTKATTQPWSVVPRRTT
jgi:hypothetical protein